jgi:maltose alpha-D-glucosyltransferase/alpha-amylase
MFGRSRFPRIGELPYLLTLAPRGFFWFILEKPAEEETEKHDADRKAAA